jgi:hypothetical protein
MRNSVYYIRSSEPLDKKIIFVIIKTAGMRYRITADNFLGWSYPLDKKLFFWYNQSIEKIKTRFIFSNKKTCRMTGYIKK